MLMYCTSSALCSLDKFPCSKMPLLAWGGDFLLPSWVFVSQPVSNPWIWLLQRLVTGCMCDTLHLGHTRRVTHVHLATTLQLVSGVLVGNSWSWVCSMLIPAWARWPGCTKHKLLIHCNGRASQAQKVSRQSPSLEGALELASRSRCCPLWAGSMKSDAAGLPGWTQVGHCQALTHAWGLLRLLYAPQPPGRCTRVLAALL